MKPNHQPTLEAQHQIELEIHGMTCASCATHLVQALSQLKGVQEAQIPGWQSGHATLTVDPAVRDEVLVQAVAQAGYKAEVTTRRTASVSRSLFSNGDKVNYDLLVIGSGGGGMAAVIK